MLQVSKLLNKMQLYTEVQPDSKLRVSAPPTRSDVLHACDIAEVGVISCIRFMLVLYFVIGS